MYLASASPPVRFPNVYGVDMPTRSEFVAHGLTEDEICKVGALPPPATPAVSHLECSGPMGSRFVGPAMMPAGIPLAVLVPYGI